jgi:hypothetical protein
MIAFVFTLTAVVAFAVAVFLAGFRFGGRVSQGELQRTRFRAARAERQLHDLNRDAFVAMAEQAERRGRDR